MPALIDFYAVVVARSLRFIALGLAAYYALLALLHPYFLEGPAAREMVIWAGCSAVGGLATAAVAPRLRGVHAPHIALLFLALLVLGNSLAHLIVAGELLQSTNVAIAILGAGLLFLSRVYFAGYLLACWTGWWAAGVQSGLSSDAEWSHWAFALGTSSLIATLTLRSRRKMLEEAQTLRVSAESAEAARRAEAERRELQEQVVYAEKLKSMGLLAGGIAHDFNNILVGVLGNASLALDELSPTHPAYRLVQAVQSSAEGAAELTRQMLDFSGNGPTMVDSVDLVAEIRAGAALLRASTPATIELEVDLPDGPVWLEADPTQLRQIVLNLVVNGAEAMGGRHGRISVRAGQIEVTDSWLQSAQLGADARPGAYGLVEVADEGPGIDAATLPRIFDPFFTTKEKGRGLGLASVAGIVRAHEGAVRLVSGAKGGLTVSVLFPLGAVPVEGGAKKKVEAQRPADQPTAATALVIVVADDDPTVLELAREVLERAGHRVLAGVDGREAVDLVRRHSPNLLILDMTMPRMSGLEALAELGDYKGPVLLTSGYSEERVPAEMRTRISGFLAKPFHASDLTGAVERALRG